MTEVLTVGNAESVIESNQSKLSESQNWLELHNVPCIGTCILNNSTEEGVWMAKLESFFQSQADLSAQEVEEQMQKQLNEAKRSQVPCFH